MLFFCYYRYFRSSSFLFYESSCAQCRLSEPCDIDEEEEDGGGASSRAIYRYRCCVVVIVIDIY